MEHQRQTYLKDTGTNDVDGIVIIDTSNDAGYRVTEKRDGEWCKAFWMPEDELSAHETTVVGNLSSDQYMRLCDKIGIPAQ